MSSDPEEILLGILEDLGHEDFDNFQWYLWHDRVLEGFKSIPKSKLEGLDRKNTVDEMIQAYSIHTLKVTKMVLEKMKMMGLWEKHEKKIPKPEGKSWKHENLMMF
uniref:Pyrin domain-containing protein n=1 Tax=Salarias fasciatus TaxID=181472 RepID=A0A672GYW1_SALFA